MEAELMAQISSICDRASRGDLEARICPLPESRDWNRLCATINAMLDMSDSYVRESQALLEHCGRHEYHRPVLVRGMKGAYRGASLALNRTALEMKKDARLLEDAESQRENFLAEVGSSAMTVAAACEQLTATSAEISKRLNESADLTGQAVSQSNKARDAASALAEAAERINDVLRLIKGIAGQTNLLAINANIEAAHAGERGKGFMVVANEVRSLSHDTAKATGSIAEQVQTMATVSANVETAISLINGSIQNLNRHVASIAVAVEDQEKATKAIGRQMNGLSASFSSIARGGV
jgi:methyl-accepting chemotaxis protein